MHGIKDQFAEENHPTPDAMISEEEDAADIEFF